MTDRAQPGAIDSTVRNDELAQIFSQFSDGWVVPGTDPTPAARRRADIDETALDAFALSTSSSSLDVTLAPGEAFVSGWCVRDVETTLTLPADSTSEIVVGWDPDAVYDPDTDADRDAADKAIVALAGDVDADSPTTVVHEITTDGSGVTGASRVASVGPAIDASSATLDETTTGQVDGSITSDPITSLTDGELFVDSGTLTFTPSSGPEVRWVMENSSVVSVQLAFGETMTVPSDEDWFVSGFFSGGSPPSVNGRDAGGAGVFTRLVFEGGTTLKGTMALQGFEISNSVQFETVTEIDAVVPSGETWVGGLQPFGSSNIEINNQNFSSQTDPRSSGIWVVLDGGDDLSNNSRGHIFGGFKI
jgi:hypothetical protein